MKKSLSLIEIMVAATIFAVLSVSLYLLLGRALTLRRRLEQGAAGPHSVFIGLEGLGRDLRNRTSFKEGEAGFSGRNVNLEFYSLGFDYARAAPQLVRVAYSFEDRALTKTIKHPVTEEEIRSFSVMDNIDSVSFAYFDSSQEEQWLEAWDDAVNFPQGVKITLSYAQGTEGKTLDKYVYLPR